MRNLKLTVLAVFLNFSGFLDARNKEENSHIPSYKFGILDGEPDSYNGSTTVTVASFDECVEKCEADAECILASQKADSEPCNLFKWDTVTGVKRNDSGGEGQVAFRVFTEQPACELNLPLLLNGKLYPLRENNTKEYLWRIDTSEEGWTIQYVRKRNDGTTCENWNYLRPYSDGCEDHCLLTMVQVYAEPGPLSPTPHTFSTPVADWKECMQTCYNNSFCLVASWNDGGKTCSWYGVDDGLFFLNTTSANSGKRMVIKINLNNETCGMTTDELLKDNYFITDGTEKTLQMKFAGGKDYPYYRVRSTKENIMLTYYSNEETKSTNGGYGCPIYFDPDYLGLEKTPSQQMCTRPFQFPGFSQPQSKKLCEDLGGKLWVERYANFLTGKTQRLVAEEYGKEWGFGRTGGSSWKIWLGLETDPECSEEDEALAYCKGNQKWQWSNPSWPMLYAGATNISFSWEAGHPILDKKCSYLQLKSDATSGYSIFSADCEQTDLDGFVCATSIQQEMGVPKYAEMLDKYGYN